jgi:hypothetical protein
MKRSLLRSFDPLPNALSTKALSALVAIVVLGIGVTVARYLESSTGPATRAGSRSVFSRSSEVHAAPSETSPGYDSTPSYGEAGVRRAKVCKLRSWSGACSDTPATSGETSGQKPVDPTMPSLYRPDDKSSGT